MTFGRTLLLGMDERAARLGAALDRLVCLQARLPLARASAEGHLAGARSTCGRLGDGWSPGSR